jgi:eukaryotic-like serine/threonine-protein kinase
MENRPSQAPTHTLVEPAPAEATKQTPNRQENSDSAQTVDYPGACSAPLVPANDANATITLTPPAASHAPAGSSHPPTSGLTGTGTAAGSSDTLVGPGKPLTAGPGRAETAFHGAGGDTLVGPARPLTAGPSRAETACHGAGGDTLVGPAPGAGTALQSAGYSGGGPASGRGESAPTVPTGPRPAPPGVRPIPGYEMLEKIGQGGMGVVYKARQLQLNRIVALKMILSGSHASSQDDARFIQEAEVIAKLKHPNVVQVFEFGVNPHDCKPFFSLEFIEGGALSGRLRSEPQPPALAAHMVETLARAMQAAHDQGIIHRDLKPDNVLLARAQGDADTTGVPGLGIPKITDFGLAKKIDSDDGQTRTGAVMGTPCYMAPEQAEGKIKEVGPAADQYALGAILYEMLTGRPPFKGTTVWDTIKMVIEVEPLAARQLNAGVPRDLETICLKCLQKTPGKRYASCAELADDLLRWRNGEPVRARRVSALERAVKWARRKPYQALSAAAGALLVLFIVGLGFYVQSQQARKYREMYDRLQGASKVEKEVRLDDQEARLAEEAMNWPKAKGLLDKALAVLAANPDLKADELRADLTRRLEETTRGVEALERDQRAQPFYDKAVFHETPATGLDVAGNRAETLAAVAQALAIYHLDEDNDDEPAWLDRDQRYLAPRDFLRLIQRNYELLLIWADAEAAPLPGQTDKNQARARAGRGLQLLSRAARLGSKYQFDTQIYHVRKARYSAIAKGETVAAGLPKDAPQRPNGALDWFLKGLETYRRAEQGADGYAAVRADCSEALALQADHFWARYVRAMCEIKLKDWASAKADLSVCVDRRPDFPWPRLLRGFVSSELGYGHNAKEELVAAELDFNKALTGCDDPVVRFAGLNNRGVLFIRQQRWEQALADLSEAVKLKPDLPAGFINLAKAYDGAKRFDEAVAALDHAVKIAPTVAALYDVRSALHLERNDRQAACADLRTAIEYWRKGITDRPIEKLHEALAKLLIQDKQYPEALKSLDAALEASPKNEMAYRLKAEALLALNRRQEAGEALDGYFALSAKPSAELCKARGLIHTQFREYAGAVAMYTRALIQVPNDAEALSLRGWVYLLLDAARPALEDFDKALKVKPNDADAFAGRGNARVRLRKVPEAIVDAESALQSGPKTARLLYNVATIYALAIAQIELEGRAGSDRQVGKRLALYEEKAFYCLERALEARRPEGRNAFWNDVVQKDPVLGPLRQSSKFEQLAETYRRK